MRMTMKIEYYRTALRKAWLPLVGRKRLSGFEYKLCDEWFSNGIPIETLLKAIGDCAYRFRQRGGTLYSIGVIRGDLEAALHERARMHAGASIPVIPSVERDWRSDMKDHCEEMAELSSSPETALMWKELASHLPNLSKEEARKRSLEIPLH